MTFINNRALIHVGNLEVQESANYVKSHIPMWSTRLGMIIHRRSKNMGGNKRSVWEQSQM